MAGIVIVAVLMATQSEFSPQILVSVAGPIEHFHISPDSKALVIRELGVISLWSISKRNRLWQNADFDGLVSPDLIAFSGDSSAFFISDSVTPTTFFIECRDSFAGKLLWRQEYDGQRPSALLVGPTGGLILGGSDGSVMFANAKTGKKEAFCRVLNSEIEGIESLDARGETLLVRSAKKGARIVFADKAGEIKLGPILLQEKVLRLASVQLAKKLIAFTDHRVIDIYRYEINGEDIAIKKLFSTGQNAPIQHLSFSQTEDKLLFFCESRIGTIGLVDYKVNVLVSKRRVAFSHARPCRLNGWDFIFVSRSNVMTAVFSDK